MRLYHVLFNNKGGLQTLNKNLSQLDQASKQLNNEPFIKSLFNGKYLLEYLQFPEYDLNDLNKLTGFMQPIQSSFGKMARNDSNYKNLNEKLKQFKLYAQPFPTQYDGLGLDSTTQTRLLETISSRNPMLSTKLLIHNEIVSKCLLLHGTDNQIKKYSNLLINGLLSSAYCYGEPHTGCDIGNFKMTAVRDDQCYVLNGVKSRVMLANDENKILFLVFCRITNKASFVVSDTQDFGILLVDYDAQNSQSKIKLTKKTTLANNMGLYDVEFEDVVVNLDAAISAQSPDAVKIFTDLFDTARFQIGSICIGALKEHLTVAVDYVLKTRQFEMPLSDMDMVKERLCKIQSRLYAMESTVYMTSGIVDSYANADVAIESNLTKIYCTQAFTDSIRDLQDIYSMNVPAGFDELQQLGQLLSCFLNTNDVLKQYVGIVCASHVGINQAENVRKLNDKFNHPAFLLREFMRQMRLKKNLANSKNSVFYLWEKVHPTLINCANILENSSVKMIEAMQTSFMTHGAHFVDYQLNLKRMVNIAMHVYVLNASIARCSRSYSIGLKNTDNERLLLHILCHFHRIQVDFNFTELKNTAHGKNMDSSVFNLADNLCREKAYSITDCLARSY